MNNSKEYTEEVYKELVKLIDELEDYGRSIRIGINDIQEKKRWLNQKFYFEENSDELNECCLGLFKDFHKSFDNQIEVCMNNIRNRLVEFLISLDNQQMSTFEFRNYKFDGFIANRIVNNLTSVHSNIIALKHQMNQESESINRTCENIRRDIRQLLEDINYLYTVNLMIGKNKMLSMVEVKRNGGT